MFSRAAQKAQRCSLSLENALGVLFVGVDSRLHFVEDRLVDNQLTVIANRNLEAIHRSRCRTFEVESADVVAGAVARAFELLLGLEPPRSTSEVGTLCKDSV